MTETRNQTEATLFSLKEKERLRTLAKRVAEIAALPVQKERVKLWTLHNDLQTEQPLIFIDPENGWGECIPGQDLICENPLARSWELHLLKQIFWFEKLKDDKVIEPYFDVPYVYSDTGWGVKMEREGGEDNGAFKVIQALEDYDEDFPKIHYPKLLISEKESQLILELAHELFDGILTVRRKTSWWWSLGMTMDYIYMRGLEDFMCDFLLEPEYVHKMMNLLCEGILDRLDYLEKHDLLAVNTEGTYVASGGFGYTKELPTWREKPTGVTTMDMWGFVESQETTAIDPEQYGEFIFPYHKKIAERFALNCYGCCEPYNSRWKYVKQLPRLRKVSCSPWADWEKVRDELGKNYIASIKLSPTPLAMYPLNEEAVRKDIRRALQCSKGCIPEFIMKDNHTLGGNTYNAIRWVEIVREEIQNI